jgi:hypothetical protein
MWYTRIQEEFDLPEKHFDMYQLNQTPRISLASAVLDLVDMGHYIARSTTAVVCYRILHWLFENYGLDDRATGIDWKGYPQKWQALPAFQCETMWSPSEKQFGGILLQGPFGLL